MAQEQLQRRDGGHEAASGGTVAAGLCSDTGSQRQDAPEARSIHGDGLRVRIAPSTGRDAGSDTSARSIGTCSQMHSHKADRWIRWATRPMISIPVEVKYKEINENVVLKV